MPGMKRAPKDVVIDLVAQVFERTSKIERYWRHLTPEHRAKVLAAYRNEITRLEDTDNRSNKFTLD